MARYMLDTNMWITLIKNQPEEVAQRFAGCYVGDVVMSSITYAELEYGVAVSANPEQERANLASLVEDIQVVPGTAATADLHALIYAALRRKGQPIPTNDLWIAASSLEHGAALLSFDAHFQNIDGLRVGTRLEDFIP